MIGKRAIGPVGSQPAGWYSGDPKSDPLRSLKHAPGRPHRLSAFWAYGPSIVAGSSIVAAGAATGPCAQEPTADVG
jgi:hypothetical protein